MDEEHEGYRNFALMQKATRWEEQGQHIDEDELPELPEHFDSDAAAKVWKDLPCGCLVVKAGMANVCIQ